MTLLRTMNIRRLRSLVWLGTVAIMTLAGWKFTEILKAAKGGDFDSESVPNFTALINLGQSSDDESERAEAARQSDFDSIWMSWINGREKPEEEPPPPPVDEDPKFNIKPISDVVELTNYVADGGGGGLAYVKYNDEIPHTDTREIVLSVGSKLKYPYDETPFEAVVIDINPIGVVVSWGGEEFTLRTNRKDVDGAEARTSPGGVRDEVLSATERDFINKHRDAVETQEVAPDSYVIGSQDRAMFNSEGEEWKSAVRVGEQKGPDGRKEVVLSTVKPAMSKRYGVNSGDILISINGTSVTSRSQAVRYVNQNPDLPKYEVVFERKGQQVTKTIYVPSD